MKRVVVGMHEAKTHFSRLVKRAEAGDEIVVASSGWPVARIVRYEQAHGDREPGLLAGLIAFKPGFDDLPPGFADPLGE